MDCENMLNNLNTILEFRDERFTISDDLMKRKDELREEINSISTIRKVKDWTPLSVGAIDSSFRVLFEDDWGRRLYGICVSGIGFIPGAPYLSKVNDVITKDYVIGYKETEDYGRILKGLSMANEIHSAKKWFSDVDLIVIDGSAKSYIIAINQAMTVSNLENSESGKMMKSIYKETLEALYEMLHLGRVVFSPKRSDKKPVYNEVFIADKVSAPFKSDYAILGAVLEEGEYIVLELGHMPEVQPWSYTLPKKEGVSEEFLSRLFSLLKNLKIIYFKSKVGRIVKFETTIPLAVNVLYDYFILEGENILTYIVDRNAKDVMAMPSRYAHLLNFPWKYRL